MKAWFERIAHALEAGGDSASAGVTAGQAKFSV
jgi:hypothetical protein